LVTRLRAGDVLPAPVFRRVWLDTVFDCFKLDPQFEDTSTLAPYPLLLPASEWRALASLAEALSAETLAAERALLARPALFAELGLPRRCVEALVAAAQTGAAPGIGRVMRFDFHPSAEGFRLSEVNADVPGGFIEAAGFARRFARERPGTQLAGDPVAALSRAFAAVGGPVGLVHAAGYLDDRQVMHYLASRLGVETLLLAPDAVSWHGGEAYVAGRRLSAILRFFPAEWLPNLGRRSGFEHYFYGARTPQCNPATALAVQSKRLPLVWKQLGLALDAWCSALPETRAVAGVLRQPQWVLKAALGRVGDGVGICGVTGRRELARYRRAAFCFPSRWVAQRRFEPLGLFAAGKRIYPSIGVFTVDGRAAGAYARAAQKPLIDSHADDVALLIEDD
jgi:glutathionylspermidine synthase